MKMASFLRRGGPVVLLELKVRMWTIISSQIKAIFLKDPKLSQGVWTLSIQIAEPSWSKQLCYHKVFIVQHICIYKV